MNRIWGVRLGDVVDVTMGQAPSGDTYNDAGDGLPLIAGAGDFAAGVPSAKKFTSSPTKTCRHGDIVMSIRATIGTKVVSDGEYCLGRGVAGLRATSAMDQRYLWHWLGFTEAELAAKGRGATFPQVSRSDITEMAIELPPLDEQRRIAAILDKADALRQKRKRAIALLDSLTQSIFLEMFGDPLNNPKSFPTMTLGDVCTKITDGEHQNPTFASAGMPMVMASQVGESSVDLVSAKRVAQDDGVRFRRKCAPEQGDLLIVGRGATIGRATLVNTSIPFCLMGSVILAKPDRMIMSPEFIQAIVKHPKIRRELYGTSSSSAQQAIYLSHLKKMVIPVPSMEEQMEFAGRTQNLNRLRISLEANSGAISNLFSSLQHRAFSGQL